MFGTFFFFITYFYSWAVVNIKHQNGLKDGNDMLKIYAKRACDKQQKEEEKEAKKEAKKLAIQDAELKKLKVEETKIEELKKNSSGKGYFNI